MQSTNSAALAESNNQLLSGKMFQASSVPEITPLDVSWAHFPAKMVNYNHQGVNGRPLVMCLAPQRAIAWRVLDAQYFGLAQRRKRVFVVASARADVDPAKILFELESGRRDTPPSRSAGEDVAGTFSARTSGGGGFGTDFECAAGLQLAYGGGKCSGPLDVAACLTAKGYRLDFEVETFAVSLRGREGGATAEMGRPIEGALRASQGGGDRSYVLTELALACTETMPTMVSGGSTDAAHNQLSGQLREQYIVPTNYHRIRRLTPIECERLQGFPDGHTLIPFGNTVRPEKMAKDYAKYLMRNGHLSFSDCCRAAADGPRYKAIGNSMAVFVMRWIGRRIDGALIGRGAR